MVTIADQEWSLGWVTVSIRFYLLRLVPFTQPKPCYIFVEWGFVKCNGFCLISHECVQKIQICPLEVQSLAPKSPSTMLKNLAHVLNKRTLCIWSRTSLSARLWFLSITRDSTLSFQITSTLVLQLFALPQISTNFSWRKPGVQFELL